MTPPIVFLDTETTGVQPDRLAWEVAMIRRDGDCQDEITFMVDIDLSDADPFGLRVGRFYERHPYGMYLSGRVPDPFVAVKDDDQFLRPRDAAEAVARWTHGAHIVGAVPNFDTEVLGRLLRAEKLLPAWHYHLVDVENLAVGYLAGRRAEWVAATDEPGSQSPWPLTPPPWSSEDLSRLCGVEPAGPDERHTALGDARWAMRLYDAITGAAR